MGMTKTYTTAADANAIEDMIYLPFDGTAESAVRGALFGIKRRREFALTGGYVARRIHMRNLRSQEAFLQSIGFALVSEPEPIDI